VTKYYAIRIDPSTGQEVKGRYLWTPLEGEVSLNLTEKEFISLTLRRL
jgi:hypothetical protein